MAWLEDESSVLFTGEVEGNLFVRKMERSLPLDQFRPFLARTDSSITKI
jgi:hypothetical protein